FGIWDVDGPIDFSMSMTKESRTGKITEFYYYSFNEEALFIMSELRNIQPKDYLDNYLAWVGLGNMDDWVPRQSAEWLDASDPSVFLSLAKENTKAGFVAHLNVVEYGGISLFLQPG
ncbi:MAG: hypothetical protein AB7V55_04190, partial [Oscillospiraceae bacterium]